MVTTGLGMTAVCGRCGAVYWRAKGHRCRTKNPSMAWAHGASGYRTYGCRCGTCTEGHRVRHHAEQLSRYARHAAGFNDFAHGQYGYNNWGCRCLVCTAAHRKRMRATQARLRRERSERAVA